MPRLIHFTRGGEQFGLLALLAFLLASAPSAVRALLALEAGAEFECKRPPRVRGRGLLPALHVERDADMPLCGVLYLDGVEVSLYWPAAGRTWRARLGRRGQCIASRAEYVAHYGAAAAKA